MTDRKIRMKSSLEVCKSKKKTENGKAGGVFSLCVKCVLQPFSSLIWT